MKYLAAYLLASMSAKHQTHPPQAKDIENILGSVGLDCDMEEVQRIIHAFEGKNVADVIAEGRLKMASVPSGAPVAAPSGGGAAAPAASAESEKEEKKEGIFYLLFQIVLSQW
ncbi:hypothetical protein AB6A40_007300 [Gnathostoma spinigerum]|uniref:Large ribosomal subunit protein P2 n=1 Tax=Gnathostoma spinigerum TaxID=75299 RepID=A0ABD6ET07_9BILA